MTAQAAASLHLVATSHAADCRADHHAVGQSAAPSGFRTEVRPHDHDIVAQRVMRVAFGVGAVIVAVAAMLVPHLRRALPDGFVRGWQPIGAPLDAFGQLDMSAPHVSELLAVGWPALLGVTALAWYLGRMRPLAVAPAPHPHALVRALPWLGLAFLLPLTVAGCAAIVGMSSTVAFDAWVAERTLSLLVASVGIGAAVVAIENAPGLRLQYVVSAAMSCAVFFVAAPAGASGFLALGGLALIGCATLRATTR